MEPEHRKTLNRIHELLNMDEEADELHVHFGSLVKNPNELAEPEPVKPSAISAKHLIASERYLQMASGVRFWSHRKGNPCLILA